MTDLQSVIGKAFDNRASISPNTAEPALKDAVASTKELPGTHGVFTFQPNDAYGLDKRSAVVIKLEKGQWKLVP